MATIAVGDVHGNLLAVEDLLAQIRTECGRGDVVVFLGDYVDRGPDVRGCIDAIIEFQKVSEAEVVCLLGNHEDWLLRSFRDYERHSWLSCMEGWGTIQSYSPDAVPVLRDAVAAAGSQLFLGRCRLPYEAFFDTVPAEHVRFFESLKLCHRTVDCVCVHGGLDPGVDRVEDQTREALIWGAGTFPDGYTGAECVVYGHRDNAIVGANGWPMPRVVANTIGLDTISYGVLTAIRLPDRKVFQSARYS